MSMSVKDMILSLLLLSFCHMLIELLISNTYTAKKKETLAQLNKPNPTLSVKR